VGYLPKEARQLFGADTKWNDLTMSFAVCERWPLVTCADRDFPSEVSERPGSIVCRFDAASTLRRDWHRFPGERRRNHVASLGAGGHCDISSVLLIVILYHSTSSSRFSPVSFRLPARDLVKLQARLLGPLIPPENATPFSTVFVTPTLGGGFFAVDF
jgi:hypothetical protein